MSELDKLLTVIFKDAEVFTLEQVKEVADALDKIVVFSDR